MGKLLISVVATTVLVSSVSGCSGQTAETRKQLAAMNDRIAILQNERDRLDERVSALEQQAMVGSRPAAKPTLEPRPPLRVVTLQPEASAADASSDTATSNTAASDSAASNTVVTGAGAPANEAASDEPRILISGSGHDLTATEVTGAPPLAKGNAAKAGEQP